MQEHATALAEAIEDAVPRWVERSLARHGVGSGVVDDVVADAMRDVVPRVRALLDADVDAQGTTPLALLRDVVPLMTAALRAAGVAPVARDDFSRARFPYDDYGLTPASWSDVDEALLEPGIAWGAAKAWTHKQRHA